MILKLKQREISENLLKIIEQPAMNVGVLQDLILCPVLFLAYINDSSIGFHQTPGFCRRHASFLGYL